MEGFRKEWLNAARNLKSDFVLAKTILNHIRNLDEFVADEFHLDMVGSSNERISVLDFGCGLCRNAVAMVDRDWIVTAYDYSGMIDRARSFQKEKLNDVKTCNDWSKLVGEKFDAIFASLVFQHMDSDELSHKLNDLSLMTDRLVVFGRRARDDGGEVWPLVCDYFNISEHDDGFKMIGNKNDHNIVVFEPLKKTIQSNVQEKRKKKTSRFGQSFA